MEKFSSLFSRWQVIATLFLMLMAIVAIYPNPWADGVTIRGVEKDSAAALGGIVGPRPTALPMSRERIVSLNSIPVHTITDYNQITSGFVANQSVHVKTTKGLYRLITKEAFSTTILPTLENRTIEEIVEKNITKNGTVITQNVTVNKIILVNKTITTSAGVQDIGLSVYNAPSTNLIKGLDLEGGARVLLAPETKLSTDEMGLLIENLKERLNVYGLSDIVVRDASDLSGTQYIIVEIAGANEREVRELVSKQGKFEAKIGNDTVFFGGNDITYVCRSADCAGLDPNYGCGQIQGSGWSCRFRFSISLSPAAAQRQADLTEKLQVVPSGGNDAYLSSPLDLFLDDSLVDTLQIGADLRGRAVTDISISGSGVGGSREEAVRNTLESMKKLQTVLITGSLPVKLTIVKTDAISPTLGEEFLKNALVVALAAVAGVVIVLILRYRKVSLALPIALTMMSEVLLTLGTAALIRWNIDLVSIAGIIVTIGTGVNDQIVIIDEALTKRGEESFTNWKQKLKNAFYIIVGAYMTVVAAMLPLLFAGAGLLRGFAFTTLIGITFGVIFTRPAFAYVVEVILKEE